MEKLNATKGGWCMSSVYLAPQKAQRKNPPLGESGGPKRGVSNHTLVTISTIPLAQSKCTFRPTVPPTTSVSIVIS